MGKVCTKCKIEKDTTEFYKDKNTKDGRKKHCKSCVKTRLKTYYEANKDKIKACRKAHYEVNKDKIKEHYEVNKDKIKDKRKEYYEVNKDKIKDKAKEYYEVNKDKRKAYSKIYFQTEKGKEVSRRRSHKRRAKIKQVADLGAYTTAEWEECLKNFNYCDAYTGEPLNKDISIDHITPINKGGTNNINNLVPCKKSINSSKKDNLIDEWYPKQPFYSKKRHNKIKEWIRIKSQINLFEL